MHFFFHGARSTENIAPHRRVLRKFLKLFQQLPQLTNLQERKNSCNLFIDISLALFFTGNDDGLSSTYLDFRPSSSAGSCLQLLASVATARDPSEIHKRASSETYNRQTLEIKQHPSGLFFLVHYKTNPRSLDGGAAGHIHFPLAIKKSMIWMRHKKCKKSIQRGSCICVSLEWKLFENICCCCCCCTSSNSDITFHCSSSKCGFHWQTTPTISRQFAQLRCCTADHILGGAIIVSPPGS